MGDSSFASNTMKSGGGPSISMIDKSSGGGGGNAGAGGVGTYKGVMLCNRPFAGTDAAKAAGGDGPKQFAVGVVPSAFGLNAALDKQKVKRKKKETALTKHRKWLAELQRKKDELEIQYTVEVIKNTETKDSFMEGEGRIRKKTKEIIHKDDKEDSESKAASPTAGAASERKNSNVAPAESKEAKVPTLPAILPVASSSSSSSDTQGSESPNAGDKPNPKNRPAWSYAKEEDADMAAQYAAESKEEEEVDDLLKFAEGLDFDKYMDDVEIKTMMEMVGNRIRELEKDSKLEAQLESEAEMRGTLRAQMKDVNGGDENINNINSNADDDGAIAAAKDILENTDNLKAVHSTNSVAAMVRNSARGSEEKSALQTALGVCELIECHPRKMAAKQFFYESHQPHGLLVQPSKRRECGPVLVCASCISKLSGIELVPIGTPYQATHDASEGTRVTNKAAVNKLPYMNRNPAV